MAIEAHPRQVEVVVTGTGAKDARKLPSTGEKSEAKVNVDVRDESEGGCWTPAGRQPTDQA